MSTSDPRGSRRALFGRLRDAFTPEPAREPAAPKPFVGLRDLRPRGEHEAPGMALPAERALSAEVAGQESPPPWAVGEDPRA